MPLSPTAVYSFFSLTALLPKFIARLHASSTSNLNAVDSDKHERRNHDRMKCNWPAKCLFGDGRSQAARIVDVSEGGLGLCVRTSKRPGDRFQISIDSIGDFWCEIAWTSPEHTGVRLLCDADTLSTDAQQYLSDALSKLPMT